MKIAIWGAGAVGLGLATALARPGDTLRLLVRSAETAEAIRTQGLTRTGLFGVVHVPADQIELIDEPERLTSDPPDWLLICTKTFSMPDVARALEAPAQKLIRDTRLLLCQNGWGNEVALLDLWPRDRLFHARIITGFHRRQTSSVEITAHASAIALGSLFGETTEPLTPLAARLAEGGIPTGTSEKMSSVLWAKMLYNCALNPLGALTGRRYGDLTNEPTLNRIVQDVIREIFSVLIAAQIELEWPDADAYLDAFYGELIPPTADHESSMLQDLRAGDPTEIEALCGAVERLGATHDVSTPVVSALATLVRTAERQASSPTKPQPSTR